MEKQWNEPYLIQRLNKPFENPDTPLAKFGRAFSFGGGLRDGGFSKEGMKLLEKIMEFDYTGSSEFEWGDVPRSFSYIAEHRKNYVFGSIQFKGKPYQVREIPEGKKNKKLINKPSREVTIWYICNKDEVENVEQYLVRLRNDKDIRLKETAMFRGSIFPEEDRIPYSKITIERLGGWIDIVNHFMFFSDETMFQRVKELFRI